MTTPNEKIARGITRRERKSNLTPSMSITRLGESAASEHDAVARLRRKADEAGARLEARLADIRQDEKAAMVSGTTDMGLPIKVGSAEAAQVRKIHDRMRVAARREAAKAIEEALDERRRTVRKTLADAEGSGLDDPQAWASQHGLGTEEMSRYINQYSRMGKAGLTTAARNILASRNKLQAAALHLVIDSLPANKRPDFSTREVTSVAFGDEVAKASTYINSLRKSAAEVEVIARELDPNSTTGSVGDARIKKGIVDRGDAWGDDDG